jgi:four helix bundle protein
MRDPMKLRITPAAEDLAVATYQATRLFPNEERYGLIAQMRSAAVSIGSNISEGCGVSGDRAFIPFLHHALASASELEFQARLSIRLKFGDGGELTALLERIRDIKRQLTRLIIRLRERVAADRRNANASHRR